MDSLKTYANVLTHDAEASFRITRMESIYDERQGAHDEPHRHDYYTIVIAVHAHGKHIIDFHEYPLAGNQVFFIAPGQMHQVIENERSVGYAIVFTEEFLVRNGIRRELIDDLNLFRSYGEAPPLDIDQQEMQDLSQSCENILSVSQSGTKYTYEALGAHLKLLLIACQNLCALKPESHDTTSGTALVKDFKALLEQRFNTWHSSSAYAEALNVSPDHLNRVVRSTTGKTAKEHVQARITVGAKRLLFFTDMSIKEIGYDLGFSEPGNFSAFFKKCTGHPPSHYRKSG